MPVLISEQRKNLTSRIAGEIVTCNEKGEVEVSEKVAQLLLSDQYSFLGFSLGGEIKKIEENEPLKVEKGEEIKVPVQPEVGSPAEEIEKEEAPKDQSLAELIEGMESINELKEAAKTLELPKEEWENYKRKDYFKQYLLSKI